VAVHVASWRHMRTSWEVITPPASLLCCCRLHIAGFYVLGTGHSQPAILSLRHQIIRSRQPQVFYSAHYLISQSNFYSTFREFTTPSSKIKIGAQLVYFALYVHVWYSGLKVPDTRIWLERKPWRLLRNSTIFNPSCKLCICMHPPFHPLDSSISSSTN
jgi:hypothetical protein